MNHPLAYERPIIRRDDYGFIYLLWRRQAHKTTTLAKKALKVMMKRPGVLVTYASASLLVGKEMIIREGQVVESAREKMVKDAQVLRDSLGGWKQEVGAGGRLKFDSNGDGLSLDDFTELFERQRLEFRVWHSSTVYSRTLIIAPNPATAVGYSGWVFIDEAGRISFLKELFEAMEPILSSDPEFRLLMAGTPPPDDDHYSYELTVPPEGTIFTPDPNGHWYESQAGVTCHHVDSFDAAAAGLKTYSLKTRAEITPEQHRAEALDRDAWDRNYGLIHKAGGTAAVSLAAIHTAMLRGRGKCVFAEDEFPLGWRDLLGTGKIALGFDIATTENEMSNPSSLTVMEQLGNDFFARLKLVWKTSDPAIARSFIREALDLGPGRRARRLCVDATNERYFAVELKREFSKLGVIVELVVSSESIEWGGEKLLMKTYLGNLVVNTMEDNCLALPESRYVKEDYRLVKRDRGAFATDTDTQGRHGDTFDSDKLALHGLIARGGPVVAEAVSVSTFGGPRVPRGIWIHQLPEEKGEGIKIHV